MDKNKNILIVDDEPTIRIGFTYSLLAENYHVDSAANGEEALTMLGQKEYDALILDLRMPEIDGLEVARILREKGNLIPIILASAHADTYTVQSAVEFGVVDYLNKPVTPAVLRKALARTLERKQEFQDKMREQPNASDMHTVLEWAKFQLQHLKRDTARVALESIPKQEHNYESRSFLALTYQLLGQGQLSPISYQRNLFGELAYPD